MTGGRVTRAGRAGAAGLCCCCCRSGRCLRKWGARLPKTLFAGKGRGGRGPGAALASDTPGRAGTPVICSGPIPRRGRRGDGITPASHRRPIRSLPPGPSHSERSAGSKCPPSTSDYLYLLCCGGNRRPTSKAGRWEHPSPVLREHLSPAKPMAPHRPWWPNIDPQPLSILSRWMENTQRVGQEGWGRGEWA